MELLGPTVVLFLMSREASILFSGMAAPISIPTNRARGLPSPHGLSNTCYLLSFDLHALMINEVHLLAICMSSVEKCSFQISSLLLNLDGLLLSRMGSSYIFGY